MLKQAEEIHYESIMKVWEASVRATHHFLKEEDILFYKQLIPGFLPQVNLLVLQEEDGIQGFIGISEDMIDMLFIAPESRGKGLGKKMVEWADARYSIHKVDVNEQNEQAVGFYKKLGFVQVGRSEKDGFDKEYPILHLERKHL
ncbi:GNAT family N-acetyltransferase [Pseudopedobacter beijingensis]|uniref:GNAT family N-acetyltransferase n=1 Tax=Pseudopedobacter beijingensis TaxID=1207056 RepID=A0ABW4IDB4_9SPHI